MTRIPLLADEEMAPVASAIIADMNARGAKVPDLYRMLANAPNLLKAWTEIAWPLRAEGLTPRDLRELLIMRTALLTQAQYEWTHHWGLALAAGVSDEKLNALASWSESDCFSEQERAALAFTDALVVTGKVPDETYHALANRLDAGQLIHLALTVSFYVCVAKMASAFELQLEPGYELVPALPPHPERARHQR